jgi:hypothetical protein
MLDGERGLIEQFNRVSTVILACVAVKMCQKTKPLQEICQQMVCHRILEGLLPTNFSAYFMALNLKFVNICEFLQVSKILELKNFQPWFRPLPRQSFCNKRFSGAALRAKFFINLR